MSLPKTPTKQYLFLLEHQYKRDTRKQAFWRQGRREEGENVWKRRDGRWILPLAAFRLAIAQNWGGRKVKVTPKMAGAFPRVQAATRTGDTRIKSSLSYLGPKGEATSKTFCKENTSYCNCATSSMMDPWDSTRNVKMKVISISLRVLSYILI